MNSINPKYIPYFTNIVKEISDFSTCYKKKVGAIIIKDNRILSTGYNGVPSGMLECNELVEILKWVYEEIILDKQHTKDDKINKLIDIIHKMKYNVLTRHDIYYDYRNNSKYKNLFDILCKYKAFQESNSEKDIYRRKQLIYVLEKIKNLYEEEDWLCADNIDVFIENMNFIHDKYEIHAEINAITQAVKFGVELKDSVIFVTHKPCIDCAKAIISSGIKEVYYIDEYIDKRWNIPSDEIFKFNNVGLIQI